MLAAPVLADEGSEGEGTCDELASFVLDRGHALPDGFEAAGIAFPLVRPRYRTNYFAHIFTGGYSAGYYSYIWSEVLDADTVEWFRQEAARDGDGGLNRAAGSRFRQALLPRGYTRDPLASYCDLRGRDAAIDPLLKRRGLD